MYQITHLSDGSWLVECMIQDGWERWNESCRENAIHSLIAAARVMNGAYIREDDIQHFVQPAAAMPTKEDMPEADLKLLADIKRGAKKVLDFDHYLLKYRISEEEAKMVVDIREGKLRLLAF